MADAKMVAAETNLSAMQIPDLRKFAEHEDSTGRIFWLSNRVFKTPSGAESYMLRIKRTGARRYVNYSLNVHTISYHTEYRVRADFVPMRRGPKAS